MKTVPTIMWRWKLIFLLPALLASIECSESKRARIYVSETYYGWVRIEYGVEGAPELSKVSFFDRQPPYRESGLLRTSSELNRDSASADIYYGTAMEVRPVPNDMIHGRISSLNVVKPDGSRFEKPFAMFFLGPSNLYEKHKQELERFRNTKGEYIIPSLEDLPKVGNIR